MQRGATANINGVVGGKCAGAADVKHAAHNRHITGEAGIGGAAHRQRAGAHLGQLAAAAGGSGKRDALCAAYARIRCKAHVARKRDR